jgi:DNA-binding protein HU-beta
MASSSATITLSPSKITTHTGGIVMNKAELVEELANQTGLTKKTSRKGVDAVISAITDSLSGGDKVTLVGFGTFQIKSRKGRRGRNPQTGQTIQIPAKKVPKFNPGKDLRGKVT